MVRKKYYLYLTYDIEVEISSVVSRFRFSLALEKKRYIKGMGSRRHVPAFREGSSGRDSGGSSSERRDVPPGKKKKKTNL